MDIRTHVAVGVIYSPDKNKVLITKRTANQHLAGLWEFPGGKVEKNETVTSALYRELNEELGIIVKQARQLTTVSYDYPDKKVLLDVWQVFDWSGEPAGMENQEIIWAEIETLNHYDFPEANKRIVQTLSLSPVYIISPECCEDKNRLFTVLEDYFSAGVKLFQLRTTSNDNIDNSLLIDELNQLIVKYKARLILNGLPSDIHKYNINGIHLKSSDLLKYKHRPVSEEYILGASCHNEEELIHAENLNVNYAFLSPVNKTKSHPDAEALGWEKFGKISRKVKLPVYALGGMSPNDLERAKIHNAYGVAMIDAIWNSGSSEKNIFK